MFKNNTNMSEFHFIIQITECAIYETKHRPSLTLFLIPLRRGFISVTLKWKILHWTLISQDIIFTKYQIFLSTDLLLLHNSTCSWKHSWKLKLCLGHMYVPYKGKDFFLKKKTSHIAQLSKWFWKIKSKSSDRK